jgi:NADH-quinone oxidoreductase subunit N
MGMGYGDKVVTALDGTLHNVLWVVAVLTMFLGNVIALTQRNIKRMLAYSSIAHSGYILIGFIVGGRAEYGFSSVVVYLIAYVIMNIGAFAIVALIGERGDRNTEIQDYAGLGFKHPLLGFGMAVFMFSMAGIPPTVGFAGKYLIFSSAVQAGEVTLAVLAVLCSAISAYYYLRVIVYMYMKEPTREARIEFALPASLVIGAATIATLSFGIMPSMLIHAARRAANI